MRVRASSTWRLAYPRLLLLPAHLHHYADCGTAARRCCASSRALHTADTRFAVLAEIDQRAHVETARLATLRTAVRASLDVRGPCKRRRTATEPGGEDDTR